MQSAGAAQQFFAAALARGAGAASRLLCGALFAMQMAARAGVLFLCLRDAGLLAMGPGPMRAVSRLHRPLQTYHATVASN